MIRRLFTLGLMIFAAPAMAGEAFEYKDGDVALEGYLARAETIDAPVVLIVHQWTGVGAHEKEVADKLAADGYTALALDIYGKGVRPAAGKDAGALAGTYKGDPALSRGRVQAGIDALRAMSSLQATRFALIGYCFGGTVALDYARGGSGDVAGVVSFHGGLASAAPVSAPGAIKPSIAVFHGADDPHVPPAEVEGFIAEMKTAQADWSFSEYAGAVHAFTEPSAGNDPSKGAAYNEKADRRSWAATEAFLAETLKP